MFPPKLTVAMKERIREVGRKREEAKSLAERAEELLRELPTTKQLSQEAGVCIRRVQEIIASVRKLPKRECSTGNTERTIPT